MTVATRQAAASLRDQRSRRVRESFAALPERYAGAESGCATFQIRIGDVGRAWEVIARRDRCTVRTSPTRKPDVVIGTDAGTWLALQEGRISGVDAFAQRRLYARGDLDMALSFEGLFRLPDGRPPLLRITRVPAGREEISTLVSGDGGTQVVCIHGLGANKASFFETIAALTPKHTVHSIDLPGFGSSSKPGRAPYNAPWFAARVREYLDEMAIDRVHLVGNSMGGRIALELALSAPERVETLSLLSPALAFRRRRRPLIPLVRGLRPELAAIPHPLRVARVRNHFQTLLAHPERLDPAVADIAAEEFCRTYRSRAARVAFFAAARNIYLDRPHGENGFWTRLGDLRPPALFIWGEHDRLVPAAFSKHVAAALPAAHQVTLGACGHVPQVELPEQVNDLIGEQIASAAPRRVRRRLGSLDPRRAVA